MLQIFVSTAFHLILFFPELLQGFGMLAIVLELVWIAIVLTAPIIALIQGIYGLCRRGKDANAVYHIYSAALVLLVTFITGILFFTGVYD